MTNYTTDQVDFGPQQSEQVHEHVHSDTENEVGGVLVGRLRDGVAEIRHVLPALEAVGGAAQLTFTHEVWEQLLSTVDREHPDEQIVGWYHSHPGHGIFLSSFDQFIHENFFSAPGMVALVVDPRDDAFGWFGWDDGGLTRLGSGLPVDRPDRAEIPREITDATTKRQSEERDMDAIYRGVMIGLAVLIVFVMGMWFKSGDVAAAQADARDWKTEAGERLSAVRTVCITLSAATLDAAQVPADEEPRGSTHSVGSPGGGPTTDGTSTEAASPGATSPESDIKSAARDVCQEFGVPLPQSQQPRASGDAGPTETGTPATSPEPSPSATDRG